MPIYDFRCLGCGQIQAAYRKMDSRHDTPECHGKTALVISPVRGYVSNIDYQSPVDGRPVQSKRARKEDLQRNNCREWEGIAEERKYAQQCKREEAAKVDQQVDQWVGETYQNLTPEKKQILETTI